MEAEAGKEAIRRALRSLRRRHLVEEGAHRPAIEALARPFAAQVKIPISCLLFFPIFAYIFFLLCIMEWKILYKKPCLDNDAFAKYHRCFIWRSRNPKI